MVSSRTLASFEAIGTPRSIENTPLEERLESGPIPDQPSRFLFTGTNDYSAIEAAVNEGYTPEKKVSIVIPHYNKKAVLEKTLAALTKQNYPLNLIEVVIADDGSSDGSQEMVRGMELPFDVKYVWQQDKGYRLSKARNEGIKRATHDTVIILDNDMVPTPDFVRQHMKWHHAADNIAVIGHRRFVEPDDVSLELIASNPHGLYDVKDTVSRAFNITQDWRLLRYQRTRNLKDDKEPYRSFSGGNVSLSKRQAFLAGLFDESFAVWGKEDNEFAYRLFRSGTFLVPELKAEALHMEHGVADPEKRKKDIAQAEALYQEKVKGHKPYGFPSPKVSIFVPAYNRQDYIAQAIESAVAQTFKDIEIVVCDDGSTDKTPEILKSLQDKYNKAVERPLIRVVRHEENRGIGAAWNTALRAARGEYFLQLDSDDLLSGTAAERLAEILDKNPQFAVVYGNNHIIDSNGNYTRDGWNMPGFDKDHLFNNTMISHHPRMFRASAWFRTEGVREDIENAIDYDAMIKLAERGEGHHLEDMLYSYRWHGKQTTAEKHQKQIENAAKVREDGKVRRSGIPQKRFYVVNEGVSVIKDGLTPDYFNQAVKMRKGKDYGAALDAFSRILKSDPGNAEAYVNMGMVYRDMGQKGLAGSYFSKALELNPDHKFSRQNLERLL